MSLCVKCSNSALLQTRWEKLQPIKEEAKVVHSWIKADSSPECALCQLIENEILAAGQIEEELSMLIQFIRTFLTLRMLRDEAPPIEDMDISPTQIIPSSNDVQHDRLDLGPPAVSAVAPHMSSEPNGMPCAADESSASYASKSLKNASRSTIQGQGAAQIASNEDQPGPAYPSEGSLWNQGRNLIPSKEDSGSTVVQNRINRILAYMEKFLSKHDGSQSCLVCNLMEDSLISGQRGVGGLRYDLESLSRSVKEAIIENHFSTPHLRLWFGRSSIEKVEFVLEKREHWSAIRLQEFGRDMRALPVGPRRHLVDTGRRLLDTERYLRELSERRHPVTEGFGDQPVSGSTVLEEMERSLEAASDLPLMKEFRQHEKDVCLLVPFEKGKSRFAREVTEWVDTGLIKLWLSRCEKNHSLCSQRSKETHPPGLILIDTENMCLFPVAKGSLVRYIALSYVWGDVVQPILRKAVLETWISDGQLRDMEFPQTIRDAIKLVRMIGYRYIWVDALCIVQDDVASRHGQISQMHEIYSHADMTIVAAHGHKCSEGLPGITFSEQRLRKHHRYDLPGLPLMRIPSSSKHSIEMSSWRTRGWTFQEELCSRRTLVLLPEVMFFSCASAVWREDLQLEGEDALPRSDEGLMSLASMLHGKSTGSTKDLLLLFRDLVKKYMQRTLSRADDMENAFAGVAGILEPLIGPAYHGIPERMFTEGIRGCWFWDTSLQRRAGFPSWSWTGWIYRQEQADVGIQPLTTASSMKTPLAFYKVGPSGIELLGSSVLAGYSGVAFLPGMDVELRSHFIPDENDMNSKNESLQHHECVSSGLIAFYTSLAYLRLRTPPGDFVGTSREYRVFHPQMNRQLTSIRLNVSYVAQQGTLLPFIVIDHDPDKRSFRLMLISKEGNTVERVNVTSQGRLVKEDDWKDANPKKELVFMS